MIHYAGIDLHCNNSYVVVTDEEDKVVSRGRVANELGALLRKLEPYRETLKEIAVESTYNWYWLGDGLKEAGYKVALAHVAGLEKYKNLKHQDDRTDAWLLAHLLRLKLLPRGYLYPKEKRAIRDLLRQRSRLVRVCSATQQSLGTILARSLGRRVAGGQLKLMSKQQLIGCLGEGNVSRSALSALRVMCFVGQEIRELEQAVWKQVKAERPLRLLQTVCGVGKILGLTIWLETGSVSRFASVGDYASYARCVASNKYSNGRRKGGGNRKNGNRYLRWAFLEAAHHARRCHRPAQRFYQRKERKTNPRLAWSALAHKLCRASYYVIKDQVPFNSQKLFGSTLSGTRQPVENAGEKPTDLSGRQSRTLGDA